VYHPLFAFFGGILLTIEIKDLEFAVEMEEGEMRLRTEGNTCTDKLVFERPQTACALSILSLTKAQL
jgi:hypothetical protein